MNHPESPRETVVTDIRMPFWSMVVFMVKWAIAAIPALILLAVIGLTLTLLFSGLYATFSPGGNASSKLHLPSPGNSVFPQQATSFPPSVSDRCKGSYEPEKCMEQERRLANETPQQRAQRQREIEAERKASMEKVR